MINLFRDLIYRNVFLSKSYSKFGIDTLQFLLKSDKWSKEELDINLNFRLKSLAQNAKENTDHYKKVFRNIDIEQLKIEDFKKLGTLSKKNVRSDPEKFHSKKEKDYITASSSGTSGEPMTIHRSLLASSFNLTSQYRFHLWHGIKPNARHVIIWGTGNTSQPKRDLFKRIIKDNLVNIPLVINVFDLNTSTIEKYKKIIEEYRPEYIRGYTSSIKQLCILLDNRKLNVKLKAAIVTSEICLQDDKNFISKALDCRTLEEYGSRDGGQFAYECPHGSMHIQEDITHFFTDENDEVICTELYNTAMPMFNYKPGDKVLLGKPCSCGRKSRTISSIEGRVSDMIMKADGSEVSSWILFYLLKDLENTGYKDSVSQLQVVQERNKLKLFLVKGKKFNNPENFISNYLIEKLGKDIKLEYVYLDEPLREKSGKVKIFKRVS